MWSDYPTTFNWSVQFISPAPGVNEFSARGLRGTMAPIEMARGLDKLPRTVNGNSVDISAPQFRKYKLEIRGQDQAPPALDGIWVGMQANVNSLVEASYLTGTQTPERPAVPGSERVEGIYTYYRPAFVMRVVDKQVEREEWAAVYTWSLDLEEI